MTPTTLLSYLRSQASPIPLKVSEWETITDWQTYLDNLEETLAQSEKKRCYTTALSFALKVKEVLEIRK